MMMAYRVGIGYDVHSLTRGRPLVLGGIQIPHPLGLSGHSDADVLLHAICDAMFGALALGDLGRHFPDTDPQFKGISSLLLLKRAKEIVEERGWAVGNVDGIICAQRPRLADYIPEMVRNIARVLEVEEADVSVKATTTEGLGFIGREEGIAAHAVVLLVRDQSLL